MRGRRAYGRDGGRRAGDAPRPGRAPGSGDARGAGGSTLACVDRARRDRRCRWRSLPYSESHLEMALDVRGGVGRRACRAASAPRRPDRSPRTWPIGGKPNASGEVSPRWRSSDPAPLLRKRSPLEVRVHRRRIAPSDGGSPTPSSVNSSDAASLPGSERVNAPNPRRRSWERRRTWPPRPSRERRILVRGVDPRRRPRIRPRTGRCAAPRGRACRTSRPR